MDRLNPLPNALSLRYRLLLPMLIGGLIVTLLGAFYAYQSAIDEADKMLQQEGHAIASSLNHAAMVAHSPAELQHVIEEVHKDTPQLIKALILEGDPAHVTAATIPEWIGLSVNQLQDSEFTALLTTEHRPGTQAEHPHLRGAIVIPLASR